jgi:ABC-2 type transport system permease protein
MNVRHIKLIVKREYFQRIKSPGFIIGTVLGVISIAALAFLPTMLAFLEEQGTLRVAVVDPHGLVYKYLPRDSTGPTPTPTPASSLSQEPQPLSSGVAFSDASAANPTELSKQVTKGDIDAYILVGGQKASEISFTYHGKERPSSVASAKLLAILSAAAGQARLAESGITPQEATALFAQPEFKIEPIVDGSIRDEKSYAQSAALAYVLLIFLYATMLMYGIQVAMGVVEEKSSRVMEVLITAVRPIELMIGKVLGVGLVGLTQYGTWVALGLVTIILSNMLGGDQAGPSIDVAAVPPMTLLFFLVFFVLGYLLFASIYAALGSLVNRSEEVNSITTPVTIIMVGTYLLSIYSLGNADSELVRWLSFVPFFTPMLMFIRVALSNPAWWELLISVVLLALSSLFFAWVAAKIYRVGVLLYGKRPSFREVGRLLRSP